MSVDQPTWVKDIIIHNDGDHSHGLEVPTTKITVFDEGIAVAGQQLVDAVANSGGLAVAANQIGLPFSMFAYKMPDEDNPRVVCNPKITDGTGIWSYREGCLSFPGRFWWINRPRRITMTAYTVEGERVVLDATDLKGRMIQHECDHLAGRTILGRLSLSERKQYQRSLAARR